MFLKNWQKRRKCATYDKVSYRHSNLNDEYACKVSYHWQLFARQQKSNGLKKNAQKMVTFCRICHSIQ